MKNNLTTLAAAVVFTLALPFPSFSQTISSKAIPKGAKVFVAPMEDGFDTYLKTAFAKKQVPLTVVGDKADAQYEVSGHSETQKAGAAKKAIMLNWHSNEQASIKIVELASGEVVYAYSAAKKSSAHGKQSTAESCAKHLKDKIDSGK